MTRHRTNRYICQSDQRRTMTTTFAVPLIDFSVRPPVSGHNEWTEEFGRPPSPPLSRALSPSTAFSGTQREDRPEKQWKCGGRTQEFSGWSFLSPALIDGLTTIQEDFRMLIVRPVSQSVGRSVDRSDECPGDKSSAASASPNR